jgi:hypothetical protein
LASALSLENVQPQDYASKVNWRRELDAEIPREGFIKFAPNAALPINPQAQPSIGGDIDFIGEVWRPNGQKAVVCASEDTIAWFNQTAGQWVSLASSIAVGWRKWEGVNIAGDLILNNGVELPYVLRFNAAGTAVELTRLYELREIGIASVGCICEYNGFLVLADIREILDSELNAIMNGSGPYDPVDDSDVNRFQFRVMWSEFGKPTRFALLLEGEITSGSARDAIELPYPIDASTWPAGTKLAIVGAGAGGGILETEVVSYSGSTLTIADEADAGLSYPLDVQVTRFEDQSTLVGFYDLEDDGSRIIRIMPLQNNLVVYRDTGIFTGRYTGILESPFQFRKEYAGRNVPYFKETLIDVRGEYHLYAGIERFWRFHGVGEPQQDPVMIFCQDRFYTDPDSVEGKLCFAKDNPNTREVWIANGQRTIAFSYAYDSAQVIDLAYTALGFLRRPNLSEPGNAPIENWMVSSIAGTLYREGVGNLRDGTPYVCEILSGFFSVGTEYTEKDIVGYVLVLGTGSPNHPVEITLFKAKNPGSAKTTLFTRSIPTPNVENLIPAWFRGIYFQDRIRITTSATSGNIKLTSRMIDLGRVDSKSATRTATPGSLF